MAVWIVAQYKNEQVCYRFWGDVNEEKIQVRREGGRVVAVCIPK